MKGSFGGKECVVKTSGRSPLQFLLPAATVSVCFDFTPGVTATIGKMMWGSFFPRFVTFRKQRDQHRQNRTCLDDEFDCPTDTASFFSYWTHISFPF